METPELCMKSVHITIKTLTRRQLRRSDVFIVNVRHISQIYLALLLLSLNM